MKVARAIATPVIPLMGGRFSPLALFSSGEQGAWYDPSDFSTMFQDSAGTTPVTAVEQPVGLILDKSKELAVGSELISKPGNPFVDTSGFTPSADASLAVVSGELQLTTTVINNFASIPITGLVVGKTYVVSYTGRRITGSGAPSIDIPAIYASPAFTSSSNQTFTFVFVAKSTSTNFTLAARNNVGIVGYSALSVREIAGNHASQSTAASRPVLSARVNQLTYTEQFDNAAWTFSGSARTVNYGIAPDGTQTSCRLQFSAANQDIRQNATVGSLGLASCWIKGTAGQTVFFCNNLLDATTNITLTGSWQYVTRSGPTSNATTIIIGTWNSATARDIEIWHPDLRSVNQPSTLPAYQRIAAATDYDTTGFPYYLKFDGTDDFLVTGTINPGSVDKAQVFAGVRKLSDISGGISIVELSASVASNAGSFAVFSNAGFAQLDNIAAGLFGSGSALYDGYRPVAAPSTYTHTVVFDAAAATKMAHRLNGSGVTSNLASGSTSSRNFSSYPIYIGRRGGTGAVLSGNLYGLIVRFSAANLDAGTITNAENWMNSKTGAF